MQVWLTVRERKKVMRGSESMDLCRQQGEPGKREGRKSDSLPLHGLLVTRRRHHLVRKGKRIKCDAEVH